MNSRNSPFFSEELRKCHNLGYMMIIFFYYSHVLAYRLYIPCRNRAACADGHAFRLGQLLLHIDVCQTLALGTEHSCNTITITPTTFNLRNVKTLCPHLLCCTAYFLAMMYRDNFFICSRLLSWLLFLTDLHTGQKLPSL